MVCEPREQQLDRDGAKIALNYMVDTQIVPMVSQNNARDESITQTLQKRGRGRV